MSSSSMVASSMLSEKPRVWLIGDAEQPDFAAAVSWLSSHTTCLAFSGLDEAATASRASATCDAPSASVMLTSHRAQWDALKIEQIKAALPRTRLISLAGPWCAPAARGNSRHEGLVHVAWQAWRPRLAAELGVGSAGNFMSQVLPRRLSDIERVERLSPLSGPRKRSHATAVVATESRETFDSLADALKLLGYRSLDAQSLSAKSLAAKPSHRASLAIFDGWAALEQWQAVAPFAALLASSKAVLLLNFPRPDDAARAAAVGINHLIARPLVLGDLASALTAG
jgi:hypothetical protein